MNACPSFKCNPYKGDTISMSYLFLQHLLQVIKLLFSLFSICSAFSFCFWLIDFMIGFGFQVRNFISSIHSKKQLNDAFSNYHCIYANITIILINFIKNNRKVFFSRNLGKINWKISCFEIKIELQLLNEWNKKEKLSEVWLFEKIVGGKLMPLTQISARTMLFYALLIQIT